MAGWSFSVWSIECEVPLLTRPLATARLTAGCWSPTRAAVFYVARADGVIEVCGWCVYVIWEGWGVGVVDAMRGPTWVSVCGLVLAWQCFVCFFKTFYPNPLDSFPFSALYLQVWDLFDKSHAPSRTKKAAANEVITTLSIKTYKKRRKDLQTLAVGTAKVG